MFSTERGRHLRRGRRRRPRVATLLLLVLLVAAAVVVGIAATHTSTPSSDADPGSSPALVLGAGDSATAAPIDTPSPSAVGSALTPAATTASTAAVARGSAPLPAAYRSIPVAVYNTTDITGLAGKVGARLKGLGWDVGTIASHKLAITVTTVYYDAASKDAAFWMAANDTSVMSAVPRTSGVPGTAGLTVLVAKGAS